MLKTILCIAVIAAAVLASPVPYKLCGDGIMTVKSIDSDPYPIKPGQKVTFSVDASLSKPVTKGQYHLKVLSGSAQLFSKSGDICSLIKELSCPHAAGDLSLSKSADLPGFVPTGTYTVQLSATANDDNEALVCVNIEVEMKHLQDLFSNDLLTISAPVDESAAHNSRIIETVNRANAGWTAGVSGRFSGASIDEVKSLCGVLPGGPELPKKTYHSTFLQSLQVPTSFDSREEWGKICPSLNEVRDQGNCGSCWAVAAAAAITDRTCIASNGKNLDRLSDQDLVSCCSWTCGNGCDGGYPSGAWSYWTSSGLVSGGAFGSKQGCYPYQIAPCSHHVDGRYPACSGEESTPSCSNTCTNGAEWVADKHKGSQSYSLGSVADIQADILQNGPVEAAFTVYEDFVSYKSGVYSHVTGSQLGGHAVKIVGWGEEDGTPYWLIANSWNSDWGDKGYFKILRGSDECGIESGVVAGLA